LYEDYRTASVTGEILAQDPAFPPLTAARTVPEPEEAARLFRALQLLKLITDEDTFEGVTAADAKLPATLIFRALELDGYRAGDRGAEAPNSFSKGPTVDLIVHLVFHMGATSGQAQATPPTGNSGAASAVDADKKALADLVAAVLANQPGASKTLREELAKLRSGQSNTTAHQLTEHLGPDLPFWSGLVFSPENPEPMNDIELIAALYQIAGVDKAYDVHVQKPAGIAGKGDASKKVDPRSPEGQSQLQAMTKFVGSLIERLRGNHDVKKTAKEIPLWKGYEQSVMWVLFWWTIYLLIYREVRRWLAKSYVRAVVRDIHKTTDDMLEALKDKNAALASILNREAELIQLHYRDIRPTDPFHLFKVREMAGRIALLAANCVVSPDTQAAEAFHDVCSETRKKESGNRWFIRYLTFALPAVGFIGTKRGIAGALSQADMIVRAQDPGAQAAAISTVTSILGIAFTTTLIALVMGLIINLINSAQMHTETALVDTLEESLAPLVNPARSVIGSHLPSAPSSPIIARAPQRVG
jgi:hypothetical protein